MIEYQILNIVLFGCYYSNTSVPTIRIVWSQLFEEFCPYYLNIEIVRIICDNTYKITTLPKTGSGLYDNVKCPE